MPNPLFYQQVVPLNRDAHRDLRLRTSKEPLGYARSAHLIPALVEEFTSAMAEMPIAFLPGAAHPTAVFVVGLEPGSNVFVSDMGLWQASYVPAYLRRYPFIIGDVQSADPVLCIDEAFEGLNTKEGARLFSASGEPEPTVTQALSLAQGYRVAAERTETFCALLQRLGLFRSVTLDAKLPNGQTTVVHGLLTVNEDAFDELPEKKVLELRKEKFLKPVFAHLLSLKSLSRLTDKIATNAQAAAA